MTITKEELVKKLRQCIADHMQSNETEDVRALVVSVEALCDHVSGVCEKYTVMLGAKLLFELADTWNREDGTALPTYEE